VIKVFVVTNEYEGDRICGVFSTYERADRYVDWRDGFAIDELTLDPNGAILDSGFRLFEVVLNRNGKLHRLERVYDEKPHAGELEDGYARRLLRGTWSVWRFRCVVMASDEADALREAHVLRMAWQANASNVWPEPVPPPPRPPEWVPIRNADIDDIETAVYYGNAGDNLPEQAHAATRWLALRDRDAMPEDTVLVVVHPVTYQDLRRDRAPDPYAAYDVNGRGLARDIIDHRCFRDGALRRHLRWA
jgi:hypothetical protein